MKMTSTKISTPKSWADIVKGKADVAIPAAQEPKLSSDAPEFVMPEFTFNASAQEFKIDSLNPSAKDFDPSEADLLRRAAEMQRVLLGCYSDEDDSSDDEAWHQPPPTTAQKCKKAVVRRVPAAAAVRPPPGLEGLADTQLNPFVKAFVPLAVSVISHTNVINLDCYSSDDESPQSFSLRTAASAKRTAARAAKMQSLLLECFSDDDDSTDDESPRSVASKGSLRQDSTSAGESSDSETESLSSL